MEGWATAGSIDEQQQKSYVHGHRILFRSFQERKILLQRT